jgi:hypothetical protein
LMSGEGKRGHWLCLNATAPFLDSTAYPSRHLSASPHKRLISRLLARF